ncbi:class I SAM-dependent methyltransferase [Bradyrhizobium sp. NP1]|uniref:class I SAM-dependent methyltransferase n=1 Tax=Bradyrhizobium sp. NP1 TaxID=3049772 RepID=UPI0025A54E94|nr:class I SAM-dependent methyltransferase [Bradyrhizobium sp. NP1]WJR81330.1 tetratricopeptide repeat protein [Bradyrhizobium sp. NP1]
MKRKRPEVAATSGGEAMLFEQALVLHRAGNLLPAERAYRDVLMLNPRHAGALSHLGVLAHQVGRVRDAVALLRQALDVTRRDPQIHFNLALVLSSFGQDDEAIAHNLKALKIKPDYADAHTNMGALLLRKGQTEEAIRHFNRALLFAPSGAARENLVKALFAAGRNGEALGLVLDALSKGDSEELRKLFTVIVRSIAAAGVPDLPRFEHFLIRAMQEAWCRPRYLAGTAAALLLRTPSITALLHDIDQSGAEGPSAFRKIDGDRLAALDDHRLLHVLLVETPNASLPLERVLTAVRRTLLESLAGDLTRAEDSGFLALRAALARQCFLNEYVFAIEQEENAQACRLREAVAEALAAEQPVSPQTLATLASYFPLHSIPGAERLALSTWPEPVRQLVEQQVIEVENERKGRESIVRLTPITDATSQLVREQYEQNPYPRWAKTITNTNPVSVDQYIRTRFPGVRYQNIDRGDVDFLIAGCGTGIQAVERARQFRLRTILAIDLSLSSLSYAARKAHEAGITSLAFAQADILNAQAINRRFSVIDSAGVLHHLRDPLDGWRKLIDLLEPNGLMHIGLYSAKARAAIRAAREMITDADVGDSEPAIRSFRQQLAGLQPGSPLADIAGFPDFYTLSECRDLLFHVQEHQFEIPEIASFLAAHRLNFLGFETSSIDAYRQRFPEDGSAADLERWHIFETERPATFRGMYQFWVQKQG